MIDLSSHKSIQSNLFVRIDADGTVLRFSDLLTSLTIDGESYVGLGNFLGVTSTSSELSATGDTLTITITGIPNTSITEVMGLTLKGAEVKLYRRVANASTGVQIANPFVRFRGFVSNFSLQEEHDVAMRSSSNTILIECANYMEMMGRKFAGRRTNPVSEKKFYPSDLSMDRVPALESFSFDFGMKK